MQYSCMGTILFELPDVHVEQLPICNNWLRSCISFTWMTTGLLCSANDTGGKLGAVHNNTQKTQSFIHGNVNRFYIMMRILRQWCSGAFCPPYRDIYFLHCHTCYQLHRYLVLRDFLSLSDDVNFNFRLINEMVVWKLLWSLTVWLRHDFVNESKASVHIITQ